MDFAFNVARLAFWAKNCSCLDCFTVCCINWICRTHREVAACKFCQNKAGWSFRVPDSQKKLPGILQVQKKSDWQTDNMAGQSFKFPALPKSLPDSMACRLKCMTLCGKGTLGWPSKQSDVTFTSAVFGSHLQCTFCLFKYYYIPLVSSMELKTR